MTTEKLTIIDLTSNHGINAEWAFCKAHGVDRVKHDNSKYYEDSDLNADGFHYSIKASGFSLMSGSLCEGKTEFEDIWNLYTSKVHSDRFVYITREGIAYIMSLDEFGKFVHEFGRLEKESAKNGGAVKIRCLKESKKMVKWLAEIA
jgi:hypothetical protein